MQMSRKTLLLLVAGVIVAFTLISLRNRGGESVPEAAPQGMRVVIAKRDLTPGTFVQGEQDLAWGEAPDAQVAATVTQAAPEGTSETAVTTTIVHENYLREGAVKLSDFNGAVVRRPLREGEPVPQSALMKSGEGGFMSAVLEPGLRAVSIAVNATSGNAGFISPGDRVDLIITHRVRTQGTQQQGEESVVSETFVHDVRVIAVDQQLDNPENKAILAKTVTVEVSPRQAEQVSVASEMGKISLALRSLASPKNETPEEERTLGLKNGKSDAANALIDLYGDYTRDSDVSRMMHSSPVSVVPRVTVIRGDKTESIDFYQGKP